MGTMTIKDVARICGVGVSTVSRAMNNHPDINPETKAMIMQVMKEHNYVPNNSARNLKRTASKTIAVLVKGVANPFFQRMIQIFEHEIDSNKYSMILQGVEESEDEAKIAAQLVKEKRLKGIIFLGGNLTNPEENLKNLGVPFVLSTAPLCQETFDYSPDKKEDSSEVSYVTVAVDDRKESYKMVNYLCKLGHKRIGILTATKDDRSIGLLRTQGYLEALKDNHITYEEDLVVHMKEKVEGYSMASGYQMMNRLLDTTKDFTAVYAISDAVAIGACKAIFDRGYRIPEDYSVAGFDGLDAAHYYQPSITTIRQPVEEMARETIKQLFQMIKKKKSKRECVFEGTLEEGQSTRRIEKA